MNSRSNASNGPLSIILGLGEVGRPLLEVLSRAHRVEGIDVPARDVGEGVDIMHVCYPAEIPDFNGVTRDYADRYRPGIVVIHSTVPVGTSAAIQKMIPVPVVHSPVRGKHARMAEEMTTYVKFIGTSDAEAAKHVAEHFSRAGMRTRTVSSTDASELAKLTETTYFGVLIAFAQDVDRMARETGVPYDEVVSFYEEIGYLPKVRFFPGVIGGHCVMPNIDLLRKTFDSRLLDAVEWSNELRRSAEAPLTASEVSTRHSTGR
jgi:UDP-N-acetyl-D-mannosaminuronate dehydrogenase